MALASGIRGWPSLSTQVLMLGRKRRGAFTSVITRISACKFRSVFDLVGSGHFMLTAVDAVHVTPGQSNKSKSSKICFFHRC